MHDQIYSTHLGDASREDLMPYVADFLLQLDDVKWSVVSGQVENQLIVSVRNLGYSRNAGEFVKACFSDIGNAGGHRAMAKAVIPLEAFRHKFGHLDARETACLLADLASHFLTDQTRPDRRHSGIMHDTRAASRIERVRASSRPTVVTNRTPK